MVEIKIPQEINKYESKLVGPLTTRQTVCVVCMALLCVGTYTILKDVVSPDILYGVCFFMAVPFGVCGWYAPYGMKAEKFFLAVLFNTIISSSKRFFKSDNVISSIENKLTTQSVKELNSKKSKKQAKVKKSRSKYQKETFK